MDDERIKLLVIERTERILERRARKSIWRNAITTIVLLPLILLTAYFGVRIVTERAAGSAAKNVLKNQQDAWAVVFDGIAKEALESAMRANSAHDSARLAEQRAESAREQAEMSSQKLKEATSRISEVLGFQNQSEVVDALLETADLQTVIKGATNLAIGGCASVTGACGNDMYKKPTYYFDRVAFSCPEDKPILSQFKFNRCGALDTEDEGLRVVATCCALISNEK